MNRGVDVRRTDLEVDQDISDQACALLDRARRVYVGREGQLTGELMTHEKNRYGIVKDIMLSTRGRPLLLFYVYRMGTRELLNSHGWTRQYRTLDQVVLEERR